MYLVNIEYSIYNYLYMYYEYIICIENVFKWSMIVIGSIIHAIQNMLIYYLNTHEN